MNFLDFSTETAHFFNVISIDRVDANTYMSQLRCDQWWLYPNAKEEKFSKIRARVNFAGYLVVGYDLETRIVCVENGRLTLSDCGCAAAVRFDDPRLFVFLEKRGAV